MQYHLGISAICNTMYINILLKLKCGTTLGYVHTYISVCLREHVFINTCMYVCMLSYCIYSHSVALTLDDGLLTSQKTKVVTSGSKPTLGFHTPTDDHSRSPRALRLIIFVTGFAKTLHLHTSNFLTSTLCNLNV